jgi:hypothetical protein
VFFPFLAHFLENKPKTLPKEKAEAVGFGFSVFIKKED